MARWQLEVHPVDVTPGVWCPECALPSAVIVASAVADADTLRVVGHLRTMVCPECGTTAEIPDNPRETS